MNADDEISESDGLAPQVCLSHSEISSLISRAARGAGYEWGEADEAAFASVWLARAGLNWAMPMLALFEQEGLQTPTPTEKVWVGAGHQCPIRTGIALADFASLDEGPKHNPILLRQVFQPLTLLPFAARVAETCEKNVGLSFGNASFHLSPSGAPLIERFKQGDGAFDVSISCGDTALASPAWSVYQHTTISKKQYEELTALALKMTVPTSVRSQSGAGGTDDP